METLYFFVFALLLPMLLMLILLFRHRPQTPEMQLVGRNRERGATISEILEGVNSLNNSDKKDDFVSYSTTATAVTATFSPVRPTYSVQRWASTKPSISQPMILFYFL